MNSVHARWLAPLARVVALAAVVATMSRDAGAVLPPLPPQPRGAPPALRPPSRLRQAEAMRPVRAMRA